MPKFLWVALGTVSMAIGVIGIVVPGLPTTIFLLGAAACYMRSSNRLYNWILQHKVLGVYISNYRKHKAMPLKSKIIALIMMWTMISLSVIFFLDNFTVKLIVISAGLIGTVVILMVKTLRKEDL